MAELTKEDIKQAYIEAMEHHDREVEYAEARESSEDTKAENRWLEEDKKKKRTWWERLLWRWGLN